MYFSSWKQNKQTKKNWKNFIVKVREKFTHFQIDFFPLMNASSDRLEDFVFILHYFQIELFNLTSPHFGTTKIPQMDD